MPHVPLAGQVVCRPLGISESRDLKATSAISKIAAMTEPPVSFSRDGFDGKRAFHLGVFLRGLGAPQSFPVLTRSSELLVLVQDGLKLVSCFAQFFLLTLLCMMTSHSNNFYRE